MNRVIAQSKREVTSVVWTLMTVQSVIVYVETAYLSVQLEAQGMNCYITLRMER